MTRVLMGVVHLRLALPVCLLALTCSAAPAVATFPGRNGNLVFYRSDGVGRYGASVLLSVVTFNPRSQSRRTIRSCRTPSDFGYGPGCWLSGPAVSPDGRIALLATEYTNSTTSQTHLEILNARGRLLSRVPTEGFDGLAWSPTGTSLLASNHSRPGPGLFVIGLDGRKRQQIAAGPVFGLAWSSRGDIAFARGNDLFVTRLGEQPREVANGFGPSWSPSGRRLAFGGGSGGLSHGHNIVVVNRDGAKPRVIAREATRAPTWSPDGRRLAFETASSLRTVRADGRGLRRLRPNDGCEGIECDTSLVGWLPLPRRK